MTSARRILIGGGVRSGKSSFALERAEALGERRAFIATAQAFDDEMRERIRRHREERDASWRAVEEPLLLVETLAALDTDEDVDVIVVDCLTLWISNLLLRGDDDENVEQSIAGLARAWTTLSTPCLLVTNEVGLGIVPEHALARRFRDMAGRAHQLLASEAHEVWFGAMGSLLRLKPGPVEAHWRSAT